MKNAINWFEIPVTDLDRAQAFYEAVLACKLQRMEMGGNPMALFPYDKPATGGCLEINGNRAAAAGTGVRVYLDCAPSLDAVLARVEGAGGTIIAPKMTLPDDIGVMALMRDCEGNEVGLHAAA